MSYVLLSSGVPRPTAHAESVADAFAATATAAFVVIDGRGVRPAAVRHGRFPFARNCAAATGGEWTGPGYTFRCRKCSTSDTKRAAMAGGGSMRDQAPCCNCIDGQSRTAGSGCRGEEAQYRGSGAAGGTAAAHSGSRQQTLPPAQHRASAKAPACSIMSSRLRSASMGGLCCCVVRVGLSMACGG